MVAASMSCGPRANTDWAERFGYASAAFHAFQLNEFGYPTLPTVFAGDTLWLPFDTGNMVGFTIERASFRTLGFSCDSSVTRRDSGGQVVSESCVSDPTSVVVFDREWTALPVFEFEHASLPGLVGPDLLPGTRFTLDYRTLRLAVDSLQTPPEVPGFVAMPLVRSPYRPRLILLWGAVRGRQVIVELDTGKSRTTVDRRLVEDLDLEVTEQGAVLGAIDVGPWRFDVASARVVDTSGISRGLPARIMIGVGSDLLQRFVWTVDYAAGRVYVSNPGA